VDAEDAGRPAVQCSAEAVYFVEATANCTLSSMGYASMGFRRGRESAMGFAAWIHCKVLHHADTVD
jgi:hypothetical protein